MEDYAERCVLPSTSLAELHFRGRGGGGGGSTGTHVLNLCHSRNNEQRENTELLKYH